jgi:hypothetical protein
MTPSTIVIVTVMSAIVIVTIAFVLWRRQREGVQKRKRLAEEGMVHKLREKPMGGWRNWGIQVIEGIEVPAEAYIVPANHHINY